MSVAAFRRKIWPLRTSGFDDTVSHDAAELIQLWGNAAYEKAAELSWREDTGLMATSQPGHWWRVRREIGRRIGQKDHEPKAEFAA